MHLPRVRLVGRAGYESLFHETRNNLGHCALTGERHRSEIVD